MATVRFIPSQTAIGIGGQRASIFQSVFPNLRQPDATGMFSNPAMIPHLQLPSRPGGPQPANSPVPPPPGPVIHKSAATVAAEKVAAQLAANPPVPKPKTVLPTRANTPARQSAGTQNTNFVNRTLELRQMNPNAPGGLFGPQTPEQILFNNPLAPNVRETAPMRNNTGPSLNVLFPTR